MYLDKEAYERAGLVGKPHGVKGKRGLKPRWSVYSPLFVLGSCTNLPFSVVEIDLMSPSMFPGKKGFDRLVYAAKNALNTPVTWLFYNISDSRALLASILVRDR